MFKTTVKVGFVGAIAYGSYGMYMSKIKVGKGQLEGS